MKCVRFILFYFILLHKKPNFYMICRWCACCTLCCVCGYWLSCVTCHAALLTGDMRSEPSSWTNKLTYTEYCKKASRCREQSHRTESGLESCRTAKIWHYRDRSISFMSAQTRTQRIWQQRNVASQLINLWLTAIYSVFDRVIADGQTHVWQRQLNTALQQLAYRHERTCHDLIIL